MFSFQVHRSELPQEDEGHQVRQHPRYILGSQMRLLHVIELQGYKFHQAELVEQCE